ncbi:hypothetical protein Pan241w_11590 [Gimesia alba]|uniref:Uncharacterized protein n=1 Tax=Gimesia alba TaxID=2527973 RepID=A0A517RB34_9PLAN|nr:hypothetical protein [Gimesia alba]QDT41100.1 hypothetical protein Pan241w_11590 [Gimesia alba]
MTDQLTETVENAVEEVIPARGLYIPKWVIVSVIIPIVLGGVGATAFITSKINDQVQNDTVQSQQLIQIGNKLDSQKELMLSQKELMLRLYDSQQRQINQIEARIESRIFGKTE